MVLTIQCGYPDMRGLLKFHMVSIGFYSRYECLVKAVTPKTQLLEPKSWCGPLRAEESQPRNSFVMKIVKRYLQKGETADLSESLRALKLC